MLQRTSHVDKDDAATAVRGSQAKSTANSFSTESSCLPQACSNSWHLTLSPCAPGKEASVEEPPGWAGKISVIHRRNPNDANTAENRPIAHHVFEAWKFVANKKKHLNYCNFLCACRAWAGASRGAEGTLVCSRRAHHALPCPTRKSYR